MSATIHCGDVRDVLRSLEPESVQCVVTSPPYWGSVRDYGHDGQLGHERQPESYVAAMVEVASDLHRVLRGDGSLWLNVGDVYAASGKGGGGNRGDRISWSTIAGRTGWRSAPDGYKRKDLTLVAFQLAHELRRSGWYLRQTIIWSKPAAVEPMRLDRPALSHEYLFLFAKSVSYACSDPGESWWGHSVWQISPSMYSDHPATMPPELARRCILAGSREGDTVLDPFCGSGTTGVVSLRHGRSFVGIELNPEYVELARRRIHGDAPLFNRVEVA